jgi:hypothetical protein
VEVKSVLGAAIAIAGSTLETLFALVYQIRRGSNDHNHGKHNETDCQR